MCQGSEKNLTGYLRALEDWQHFLYFTVQRAYVTDFLYVVTSDLKQLFLSCKKNQIKR